MKYYNITVNGVAYSVSVEETAAGAAPVAPCFVCHILCKDIKNFVINRDLSVFFYIFAE